jgi:cytochrome b561
MTTQTRSVVYVVDDDQGMLDSTVWLLESVGLHALAALMHHYLWKDNTLLRMMPRRR